MNGAVIKYMGPGLWWQLVTIMGAYSVYSYHRTREECVASIRFDVGAERTNAPYSWRTRN